ncbi:[protein-PII] uridylyltransferase [Janibacter alittae]|uniref:Bifunctional uridylyltransferase/uridylyl-removing enzyme n=1 Tax=Janibacter alittae TaxID=3115209 RepID=A0ABZ2MK02_9MICO
MTAKDIRTQRLDLAGTRVFATPGAGPVRRAAIAGATRAWLTDVYTDAVGQREGVALAAVGSLARGWSGPLSDLDLVLVHNGRSIPAGDLTELADRLWYPVWDSGLVLDHSVRSVAQCRAVAGEDLSAATALLDLTVVAGDDALVETVRSGVGRDWRSRARTRLPAFVETVRERHRRHGDLSQQLQPDLKEALGGLRDVTVLRALTRAWLADQPHGSVDPALECLLDVRDALHVVTGRGRDRLVAQEHDAVTALLGLTDPDDLLTKVSSAARTIAWALESTMRRAGQSQRARTLRVGPRQPRLTPLGHGLHAHDGEVVLGDPRRVSSEPSLPLRAAVVAARSQLPLAPMTLTNLARSPQPLEPWAPEVLSLLTDLLASRSGLAPVWEGLDQVGVIERWLPEWAGVRCRPQRNPVHEHTVDRHLLATVEQAGALSRDVARPDLLLLAALLHDIGKIAGARDHARTGAGLAGPILDRWGLPEGERDLVVLLVREHLMLIELATRRDLADPATALAVCDLVGEDAETFELLRALTIADARAAGPAAWTDWRATLVDTLTGQVRAHLTGQAPAADVPVLSDPVSDEEGRLAAAEGRAHVRVEASTFGWTVTVQAPDRRGVFADTAGLLATQGFVVRRAKLVTVGDLAVDEWVVESPGGDVPQPERLVAGLLRLAAEDRSLLVDLWRTRRPRTVPERTPARSQAGTRAFVVPGTHESTLVEVRSADRPGLLHDIGRALGEADVDVRSAHVATVADQTLNTFRLTDREGEPLAPAAVARAISAIIDACDG